MSRRELHREPVGWGSVAAGIGAVVVIASGFVAAGALLAVLVAIVLG